jgi:hypothetical protein
MIAEPVNPPTTVSRHRRFPVSFDRLSIFFKIPFEQAILLDKEN